MDSEPMCRACLSESGDAVPIFSSAETSGVQMPLSEMMMACSSVQVMSGDGLPSLICLECLRSLLIAFEFKLKCEKTDAMLREYIENNLVPMQMGTTTAVYNKSISVDSSTLVPVVTATTAATNVSGGEIKQIVGANELISAIPTIAINNANAIYSNANPYIIPMVECDVLVKEEQDSSIDSNKVFQKTNADTTGNIMLKKMTVESQTNLTPAVTNTSVDHHHHHQMATFSPRLITSSELIQQTQPQITIYGSEFRDLIRVSDDQQAQQQQTTIVMPKIETIQAVNTMAQCNVLTSNSYTIQDHNQLIQNSVINTQNVAQSAATNNNFISTMTIPTNVTFTIKDTSVSQQQNIAASVGGTITTIPTITVASTNRKTKNCIAKIVKSEPIETISTVDSAQQTSFHHNSPTKSFDEKGLNNDEPVNKKQKICHHKKKTVCSVTNVTDNKTTVRTNNKLQKDNKNNNQQQGQSACIKSTATVVTGGIIPVSSSQTSIPDNGETETKTVKETVYYHTSQGFIR